MQVAPSVTLFAVVKHYLVLDSVQGGGVHNRVFADGNTGIVFCFGDQNIQCMHQDGRIDMPGNGFVYGQMNGFYDVKAFGKVGMLVVVLHPYAAYSLLGIPANELSNRIVRLSDCFGQHASDAADGIANAGDHASRIKLAEQFLQRLMTRVSTTSCAVTRQAVTLIYEQKGLATVSFLSKALDTNERQLERRFARFIGTSPKHFAGVVKLHFFLALLRKNTLYRSLTDISYECGYYDQAHSIREFKKSTGITPGEYISAYKPLAVNFITGN